jgi:hypothetical protein
LIHSNQEACKLASKALAAAASASVIPAVIVSPPTYVKTQLFEESLATIFNKLSEGRYKG